LVTTVRGRYSRRPPTRLDDGRELTRAQVRSRPAAGWVSVGQRGGPGSTTTVHANTTGQRVFTLPPRQNEETLGTSTEHHTTFGGTGNTAQRDRARVTADGGTGNTAIRGTDRGQQRTEGRGTLQYNQRDRARVTADGGTGNTAIRGTDRGQLRTGALRREPAGTVTLRREHGTARDSARQATYGAGNKAPVTLPYSGRVSS